MQFNRRKRAVLWTNLAVVWAVAAPVEAEPVSVDEAREALAKAVGYFRQEVSTRGGYLWVYSEDLAKREGEGKADEHQIWVQPPGTPSVGMACLRAYERTGDRTYLEAAGDAARALAWGQLGSGGWGYRIDFHPSRSETYYYRRDVEAGDGEPGSRFNVTTFDDDTSQSALRLLMLYDKVTGFQDGEIHRAAMYALDAFLRFQYPNGAWPQRAAAPVDVPDDRMIRAGYPGTWPRTFPGDDYKLCYTLNDATIPDVIDTMLLAHEVYGDERYLASAKRGGDFLILAQMPDPQPAWCQQYSFQMQPVWARKFEPPAIVSRESVDVIRALIRLHVQTGDHRYLQPIPRALAWMERTKLEDGRLPRFSELHTNRPLYFTTKYELVYTDDDCPTHYAFKMTIPVDRLRQEFRGGAGMRQAYVQEAGRGGVLWQEMRRPVTNVSSQAVRAVIDALDGRGRWVEDGRIRCSDFIRNVDVLTAYIAHQTPASAARAMQPEGDK